MPRERRIDAPGLLHHVMCRGIEDTTIFRDNDDAIEFLDRISRLVESDQMRIFAFALMPNHVHLLTKTLLLPLPAFMRRLLTGYAMYFNKRHKRKGHLFQNRYKSLVVDEESYLYEVVRYIHLNPIRAGIVRNLAELAAWPFSGHSTLMGTTAYRWIGARELLSHFSSSLPTARKHLVEFMADGLRVDQQSDALATGISAPDEELGFAFGQPVLDTARLAKIVLNQSESAGVREIANQSLERLLEAVAHHYGLSVAELCSGSRRRCVIDARFAAIWLGVKKYGFPPVQIAKSISVEPPAVYRVLSGLRGDIKILAQEIEIG